MKKLFVILVILLCVNVYADNVDCTLTYWIRNGEATYDATRNDASGSNDSSGGPQVGQATGFNVHRGYLHFTIPALANCTSCYLYMYGDEDHSTTDFQIMAYLGEWSNNPSNAVWEEFDGWESSGAYTGTTFIDIGEWSSSEWSSGWNVIELNAAGRAAVYAAAEGVLKIALISKEDVDYSEPTDDEYVSFEGYANENRPYLRINDPIGAGYTGTACGVDNPKNVLGVEKANLKNFLGVE